LEESDLPHLIKSSEVGVRSLTGEARVQLARPARFAPASDAGRFVVELLSEADTLPLGELASRLAEFLYRKELETGAGALDIGLFGSALFVSDAYRELKLGSDNLWKIVQGESDELPSNLSGNDGEALSGDRRRFGR